MRPNAIDKSSFDDDYRRLVETSPDGIIVSDRNGRILFLNHTAEDVFACHAGDVLGKFLGFAVRDGESAELRFAKPGEPERIAEVRVRSTQWQNEPAFLICARDITEITQVEQLKAEINEKRRVAQLHETFVSTLSHDLRSPLSVIREALDNLKDGIDGPLNEDQLHMVGMASRNIDRLVDLMTKARLSVGKAEAVTTGQLGQVDLPGLIREVCEGHIKTARDQRVLLTFDLPEDLPPLYFDPQVMRQVLHDWLCKAVNLAHRSVEVKVRLTEQSNPFHIAPAFSTAPEAGERAKTQDVRPVISGFVQISIVTDGDGLSSEQLRDIFRQTVVMRKPDETLGEMQLNLELARCKETVEKSDGKLWVESQPEEGTQLHFVLPIYQQGFAPC